jgi:hypothetical protein
MKTLEILYACEEVGKALKFLARYPAAFAEVPSQCSLVCPDEIMKTGSNSNVTKLMALSQVLRER